MRKNFLYVLLIGLVTLYSCTDDFAELNTNPSQITTESLKQNFNHVGAYFPSMLKALSGNQVMHNLNNDSWVKHYATPTPFVGGVNNTTYYPRWIDQYWNRIYGSIMAPGRQVIEIAEEGGFDMFVQWTKLIQILGASRLSAYHGPIIYSNYGSQGDVMYDSEADLYNTWFTELDQIVSTFSANTTYPGFKDFDASYGGSVAHWIKMANSLRLRLAMRISKANPSLAKTQGEKAINDAGGLITTNADNLMLSLYGEPFHEVTICFSWNDTRMSASMESILGGYDDPRASKYWAPVADASLVADHPSFPYKGILNGAFLASKALHLPYSTISEDFKSSSDRKLIDASEVHLILAEANLRGWSTPLSAEAHYQEGVKQSFAYWGAGGVDAYLANNTDTPFDYDDVVETGDVNDFVSRITATVAWNEAGTNEEKLEKIITQKWIAAYTNSIEAWVDHRRTGYPKLPYNYKNDSNSDFGVIAADDFMKRMVFPVPEKTNNPSGYSDAVSKLGGADEIGTRLYWDTGASNF
ncbi:SusD/RagB family nutrient-binding outer membrane lipoprotein [Flavobacteriaceae bacterium]|nr:SusD/RagB family nutrient-binding outer membrane lipoprotein [Flavobacteriaceae bacterium]